MGASGSLGGHRLGLVPGQLWPTAQRTPYGRLKSHHRHSRFDHSLEHGNDMTIARNAVRSITRGWLATTSPRIRQRIPASQSFWICTRAYSRTGRDVLAAYRKPTAPSARPVVLDVPKIDELHADEVFRTVSTSPAGSSMQEIPPPSELQGGSRLETPIPAMKALEEVLPSKRKLEPSQSRKEIIVQGVPIPPKPIAPGEEGEWASTFLHF